MRELLHRQLRPSTTVEQQHRSQRENSGEEARSDCTEINSFPPFPISLQNCQRGKRKLHWYRFPACSLPGARYAVTEMGPTEVEPACPVLTSCHPAMGRVTCSRGDHTVLRNTSRVFFSALIRCCAVPLILWVSSRFHYLCLCLADAGCISFLLNPGCAEHGAIPSRHGFKLTSFKRGQESLPYCKAQPWEVKRGSAYSDA